MTRKELCKATGLSVKTLRLYEEKGLIAPARERRNGREYREYTPELMQQLEQIVMLRRALFTMDEIKTMQEQPEKIPEIFRGYQQWLVEQEEQFRLLRRAAEHVSGNTLDSIDGLLTELRDAASTMPLPAMDIKPNFKRIDEMDEGPRHVEQQRYFDELVPDEKVFRQVNLALDRDRANDINVAFGQYNQLRQDWKAPQQSGAVQRERVVPKWLKIVNGIVTGCIILGLVLTISGFGHFFYVGNGNLIWNITWILFLVRLALAGIPAWLDHRRWLKQAQQEDYQRQQKFAQTDFDDYAEERKRWKKYLLPVIAVCVVAIGATVGLYVLIDRQVNPDADYRVCFAFPDLLEDRDLYQMRTVLSTLMDDLDGNGKAVAMVDYTHVHTTLLYGVYGISDEFCKYVRAGEEYSLFFIAGESACEAFRFENYCRKLPEDMVAESQDWSEPYRVELTGASVFQAADLEDLQVYGCISQSATDEEYEFAVELLRKILADQ